MEFNVTNRYTGDVQFTAEIDCDKGAKASVKLQLAVLWAKENDADLRYANLSRADLRDVNLSDVNLSGADLRYADLRYADLSRADLSRADLSDVNLSGADLRYADLRYADLSRADLSDADLRYVNLSGADLRYADLRYADLSRADLSDADLRYVNLSGADLRYTYLSRAGGYIVGAQRTDGYRFDVRLTGEGWRVVAGCRTGSNWTTDQYRKHTEGYEDERKRAETLCILDYLDARIAMEKKQ